MQKTPILITGCQRSGNTLMRLILNSHPDILSIDEDTFDYPSINTYLYAQWTPPFVAFKLPRYAPIISFINSLTNTHVIWCTRNPLDTVYSMIKLQIKLDDTCTVSWAAHPACAQTEIINSYFALTPSIRANLSQLMIKFNKITKKAPINRNLQDKIFLGALCWRIKNELPSMYKINNIDFLPIKYEELVTTPKYIITGILDYIGVSWSDNVLKHHLLHNGVSIGNTINTTPISNKSIGGGVQNLSQEETTLIDHICSEKAKEWNY